MAVSKPLPARPELQALMDRSRPLHDAQTIQTTEWSEELIKAIAMDIGKETVAYVEVMYPQAIVNSSFKLSLRNHIYNEIMAAIKVNDAGQIEARLKERKSFRRWWVNAYRKIRQR